ncbi:MAG: topoisomerase, partial [Hyphomicrobiales bacterium]|nr:topoisomerase [Hyphomicrobiales bacterium]
IEKEYGARYLPGVPRKYTTKAKNAQEAHEAVRPTDLGRLPREFSRQAESIEQAKLYELIWTRTIASQMESAELERTSVVIAGTVNSGAYKQVDLRASGQVVRFDGFLKLYQEGKDDEDDDEGSRLPPMSQGDRLAKERIEAAQHFTEPPPRFTEATLVKRMEELGIGRPSTYASTLGVLRDREYVRIDKKRLHPEDKGRLVVAFLESFFKRYVQYDFTAALEEKLDLVANAEMDWKQVLRDFWKDFSGAVADIKDLRTTEVLDNLNELLGPHIFPGKEDGGDPRACPSCGAGQLSLKLGKFGAFVGCSNYPECRYTRTLSQQATGEAGSPGDRPGVKVLGLDPETGAEVTLRDGRFGPYVQLGEGEKPKRSSLPKGLSKDDVTLEKAVALLSLPREVAKHPTSGEPIVAGIGRFGSYVQHGKTYANLGRDDDVLEIGGNRAIDLIVTKEQGGGGASRFGASAGRSVGDHPQGGALSVKSGRYGPYVNWGKVNANLPKGQSPDSVTLEEAIALVNAKAAGGDAGGGRVLGEHPSGGAITLREGRYGPYVALGKVYANVPKSTPPESVTLADAIEWIEEKGGAPKAKKSAKKAAKKPAAKKAAAKKTASRKVIADSDEPPFDADAPKAKAAKKPAAKKVAKKAAKKAAKKVVRKAAAG